QGNRDDADEKQAAARGGGGDGPETAIDHGGVLPLMQVSLRAPHVGGERGPSSAIHPYSRLPLVSSFCGGNLRQRARADRAGEVRRFSANREGEELRGSQPRPHLVFSSGKTGHVGLYRSVPACHEVRISDTLPLRHWMPFGMQSRSRAASPVSPGEKR